MALCALDVALRRGHTAKIVAILGCTLAAIIVGWVVAIALWPVMQTTNPFTEFKSVYEHFSFLYVDFEFQHWGETVSSHDLPWRYIPGQMLARLPEGFIALLIVALLFGVLRLFMFIGQRYRPGGWAAGLLIVTGSRALMVVLVAALAPPIFIVLRHSVVFDGLRHVLFVLPPLAILAAWGLLQLKTLILRFPLIFAGAATAHLATTVPVMVVLHPYEYMMMNSLAGGITGAYGRFDLDYWSAAATEALRRLEARLPSGERNGTPSVQICIPWREHLVAPMFRRAWRLELDKNAAEYLIETERSHCAKGTGDVLIDEVTRLGKPFAWTYRKPSLGNRHE
ncbi:MAG: hypothetical protein ACREB2_03275 [Pseudolabrys sp.]